MWILICSLCQVSPEFLHDKSSSGTSFWFRPLQWGNENPPDSAIITLVLHCRNHVSQPKAAILLFTEWVGLLNFTVQIWRGSSRGVLSNIYYISTVNTQHMQGPDALLQLGYTWRHVSAVKRPSSGKLRIILLTYSKVLYLNNIILY